MQAIEFVNSLDSNRHIALLYDDPENSKMIEFQFIKNGLKKGQQCIYARTEDPDSTIIKMLKQAFPTEYLQKFFHVYKLSNPSDFPDGPLAGCKNNLRMVLKGIESPFRMVGRFVPNLDTLEGITTKISFEEYAHNGFDQFNGLVMCPVDISEIEASRRKELIRALCNSHHEVIHVTKHDQSEVLVPSTQDVDVDRFLAPQQDVASMLGKLQDSIISFSQVEQYYCVSLVDMVNSTRISSELSYEKSCQYYSIFLNSMSIIAKHFGATVVKNIGDSLLYYFPKTSDYKNNTAFSDVIECGMTMIESREIINQGVSEQDLPNIDFRISADFGPIMMADFATSFNKDIFGSPVNVCERINHHAHPNGMVVGHDLFQNIRMKDDYIFTELEPCDLGHKFHYSVYNVKRKFPRKITS